MKPRLLDSRCSHENESDYETAIDIRHYAINEETRLYELSGVGYGVRIEIRVCEIHTTGSYLEPDFDEVVATGHAPYVSHRDDSVNERTTYFHSGVLIPASIRICEGEEEFWRDAEEGWEVCDVLPRPLVKRWFDEGDDFEFPDGLAQKLGEMYLARLEANRKYRIERMCKEAMQCIDAIADQALAPLLFPQGIFTPNSADF